MRWRDFPTENEEGRPLEVGFWRKLKFFLGAKVGLWYLAQGYQHVPFYKQVDKKGKTYLLPYGTKCYLAMSDLVLELRHDRWYALGESRSAQKLNRGIQEDVEKAERNDPAEWLAAIKAEMSNEADDLIRQEMLRATGKYTTDQSS